MVYDGEDMVYYVSGSSPGTSPIRVEPFHMRLTARESTSMTRTLPKQSTNAARFPNGEIKIDPTERRWSGTLVLW